MDYVGLILSIRHNAGIILTCTFIQHNAVVSENSEMCMQICQQLALECRKLIKVGIFQELDMIP